MVRISKQAERRSVSRRRCRPPAPKTGPLQDKLPLGYKTHANAVDGAPAESYFIPKIK